MTATFNPFKTERARFLVQALDLPNATGVDSAVWESFQIQHLNDDSMFRIEAKSRQIAWSWLAAAEAVADAVLTGNDSIFVSYNLDDAKEKIIYAKQIYASLEVRDLPKIVGENLLELRWDNKARIRSVPSKPVRGKPRVNLYLDEFAHVKNDVEVYRGSLPAMAKAGRIRIGSSPLGSSGTFWEIHQETLKAYPGYTRKTTAWYEIQAFCVNVKEAVRLAPMMETQDRVEFFGNDRIKALFANMLLEDFQQEFEAMFVDESTAWLSWKEIRDVQVDELDCPLVKCRNSNVQEALNAIDQLAIKARSGGAGIETLFCFGADIGRTRNATEIFIGGITMPSTFLYGGEERVNLRLALTLDNCDFDSQESVFRYALSSLPISAGKIDQNGIGRQLAEKLTKDYPLKVQGMLFTVESKKQMATDVKMFTQRKTYSIPNDRDIAYQMHSIKRIVSESKNLVFDTARNEKHHADKFWALALMLSAWKEGAIIESFGDFSRMHQTAHASLNKHSILNTAGK